MRILCLGVLSHWWGPSARVLPAFRTVWRRPKRQPVPLARVGAPQRSSAALKDQAWSAQVLTQTYFTPFGVKAMAASTTAHGITSKMLLLGTHTDQARAPCCPGTGE